MGKLPTDIGGVTPPDLERLSFMQTRQDVLAALEQSEARYRHLVENASDGIYRITTQGYFIYANSIASRVLGDGKSLVGRHYLEFVRPDFHDDIQQFYASQMKDQILSTYYEFPAVTAGNKEIWIGQRVQLEIDSHGNVDGLHAVARDITSRKRLEDELRRSDKMRAVGQLAEGIAHDFTRILTAISGSASRLIQTIGPDDAQRRDVQQIRDAVDTAEHLTSHLLTFSRRDLFRPDALSLNGVIENARPMLEQWLGSSIPLHTCLDPQLGDIRSDAAHLEQLLLHLAVNARDAMPGGGTLTIRTESIYAETDSQLLYPGQYILMTVTDTGTGMDEETKARIFEPFFTTKESGTGSGLGLSAAYGIIRQMGGRIAVDSTPGAGTTFRIYFPQIRSVAIQETSRNTMAPAQTGGVVLVADDEEAVRQVLTSVLETNGYHVISATNGTDALSKARTHTGPIDLLLTDLVMPKMGGFELAEAFMHERPLSRVLFMSGYIDQRGLDHRTGSQVRLLHKPFDSDTILAEVRRLMPMQNAGSNAPA
jgi:PAS domain S-box-containing protein